MADDKEKLPLDARLLGEAIIELNISRRSVAIYPRGHPSVERSLNRVFELLQKLFDLRPDITLAIAKDTLIIDNHFLDKKNPVFREFALRLNRMNIAYVRFLKGLTKDELYEFNRFLSEKVKDSSAEAIQKAWEELKLIHINVGFIDYGAFSFIEGETEKGGKEGHLWEWYVHGLLEGTLQTGEVSDKMQEIPPKVLAGLLNKTITDDLKKETYDRVITTYVRASSERTFTSKELKKLLNFINELRPDLKKQFLSSADRTISKDIEATEKALLRETSVDRVIELLNTINEQKVALPETLKNLLEKLSKLGQDYPENLTFGNGLIADDIFLSPDVTSLLEGGNFEAYVTDTYQKDIQKVLSFDASKVAVKEPKELKRECSDEYIDMKFNQTILELLSSDTVSELEEYEYFVNIIKEQTEQFIETGQYGRVLKTLRVLESNAAKKTFPDITSDALRYYNSPDFISRLIDSLRIIGRLMREEATMLCDYYAERILPYLMDALIVEESQANRRFLISLITHFGDKVIPEAIKRLGDNRWYVKRNILFILSECGGEEVLPHVRSYCRHENHKVSFEAIKCLLKSGDSYGVDALKDSLRSENSEITEQAIALAGAFRIREAVPDLVHMLRKKGISGTDFYEKIPIVKALGHIGDPQALDALRDIASSKSLIFKGAIERLKEETYRTLKNYPYEDIKDLIERGLKSRNERIREEAMRLKRTAGG